MTQDTAFGGAAVSTYMMVRKTDGSLKYYRVTDGETLEITQEIYLSEIGE